MSAPSPRPDIVLAVTVSWRGDHLAVRRLARDGSIGVGVCPDTLAPIPVAPAPGEGFCFGRVGRGAALAHVPRGAVGRVERASGAVEVLEGPSDVPLAAGDELEFRLGAFRLTARAELPEPRSPSAARVPAGLASLAFAALGHAVALGLSAQAVPAAETDTDPAAELRGLMASAEAHERAPEPPGVSASSGLRDDPKDGTDRRAGGARAAGKEGALVHRDGHDARGRRATVPERTKDDLAASLSREAALSDARLFGAIGVIRQDSAVLHAPFGDLEAHGRDPFAAAGALWGGGRGEAMGDYHGLALIGAGEGGGGKGEGIGLGSVGTFGHGYDTGGGHGGRPPRPVAERRWDPKAYPPRHYAPHITYRILSPYRARFRRCYDEGLRRNPELEGTVVVRFVIGTDGAVASAVDGGSTLPDAVVIACVLRAFYRLSFTPPDGGIVTVTYPIRFSP